jgi:DNA-binding HxlR family transcriptional regulator
MGAPTEGRPGERLRRKLASARRRGDLYAPDCPSRSVLDHVTSRWGVLVLVALLERPMRFSELSRMIAGVSDKMLAQTLKHFEADGFVERRAFLEVPVRVEYRLTQSGHDVATRLTELVEWIEDNTASVLDHRRAVTS